MKRSRKPGIFFSLAAGSLLLGAWGAPQVARGRAAAGWTGTITMYAHDYTPNSKGRGNSYASRRSPGT